MVNQLFAKENVHPLDLTNLHSHSLIRVPDRMDRMVAVAVDGARNLCRGF
jgi:hypothetical protein